MTCRVNMNYKGGIVKMQENNYKFDRENKVSLHMLIEPSLKKELVQYAKQHGFESVSHAGRAILRKGLDAKKLEE